jgi:hypothetical protein
LRVLLANLAPPGVVGDIGHGAGGIRLPDDLPQPVVLNLRAGGARRARQAPGRCDRAETDVEHALFHHPVHAIVVELRDAIGTARARVGDESGDAARDRRDDGELVRVLGLTDEVAVRVVLPARGVIPRIDLEDLLPEAVVVAIRGVPTRVDRLHGVAVGVIGVQVTTSCTKLLKAEAPSACSRATRRGRWFEEGRYSRRRQ